MQLHKLIKRLVERTTAHELSWEASSTGFGFRTRVGDYLVQVENSPLATLGSSAGPTLTVTKLDGSHVAATGGGVNALIAVPTVTTIQPGTQKLLNELWELISNRDDEIEQLLNQLG